MSTWCHASSPRTTAAAPPTAAAVASTVERLAGATAWPAAGETTGRPGGPEAGPDAAAVVAGRSPPSSAQIEPSPVRLRTARSQRTPARTAAMVATSGQARDLERADRGRGSGPDREVAGRPADHGEPGDEPRQEQDRARRGDDGERDEEPSPGREVRPRGGRRCRDGEGGRGRTRDALRGRGREQAPRGRRGLRRSVARGPRGVGRRRGERRGGVVRTPARPASPARRAPTVPLGPRAQWPSACSLRCASTILSARCEGTSS